MTLGSIQEDSLLEMFVFQTLQSTQRLEQIILNTEKGDHFSQSAINEIFRIMHTIKGSAAMMRFSGITALAHKIEDFFFYIRENAAMDFNPRLVSDLILTCKDYIDMEITSILKGAMDEENDRTPILTRIDKILSALKQSKSEERGVLDRGCYKAVFLFEEGCEMENIRAYSITLEIMKYARIISHTPHDIDNSESAKQIRTNGFILYFQTEKPYDEVHADLLQTALIRNLELTASQKLDGQFTQVSGKTGVQEKAPEFCQLPENMISFNVKKLNMLIEFMDEMVIAKNRLTEDSAIRNLDDENFNKDLEHLSKIVAKMEELVLSMRLVPLSDIFHPMYRIVRDMSHQLGKDAQLKLIGEETNVDKSVINTVADSIIHLVRNCIDHGVESAQERAQTNKPRTATVTLEAQNVGTNVLITVRDDGRGLDKAKILKMARNNNLLPKPESEMTDKEIYNLIFLPGFTTRETVSEFSGRGVGLDVVMQNISAIGGLVALQSEQGKGSTVTLKIPFKITSPR